MHTQFLYWSNDASDLLEDKGLEQVDGEDEVLHELVHSEDDSSQVLDLLQMLCRSLALYQSACWAIICKVCMVNFWLKTWTMKLQLFQDKCSQLT